MNSPRHATVYKPFQDAAFCSACGACAHVCPVGAIEMAVCDDGFLMPRLGGRCVECGTCERVCPFGHPDYNKLSRPFVQPISAHDPWAAFREMGRRFLASGGMVCGPAFNAEMYAEHIVTASPQDLSRIGLTGPIESRLSACLPTILDALHSGRQVLFGGAPCRVAGILTLIKEEPKLFTVDIACSGAISSTLFKRYLHENFDKKTVSAKLDPDGTQPKLQLIFEDETGYGAASDDDTLLKIIRRGLAPRLSCAHCPFNRSPRQGDLSLWGDSAKGAAVINSPKGAELLKGAGLLAEAMPPLALEPDHPLFASTPRIHRNRRLFFERLAGESLADNVRYNLDGKCDCIVLNFWHTPNYGGILTAFALQEILKELGLRPRLGFCHVSATYYGSMSERFAAKHLALTHRCSNLAEMEGLNDLTDTFIVGSDQVWRYEFARSFNEIYYLGFVRPGHKKIACSASFGRSEFDADPKNTERIGHLIADFDSISVREKNGMKICRETFKSEATHLIDPALALAPEKYDALIVESQRKDRGFIAVYGVDTFYDLELQKLSAKLHKPLVYIKNVEVEDWLYLVKNCDFMATGSFHGTCFALLFGRPFIYCQTPDTITLSRLESLLTDFSQTSRHIRPGDSLSGMEHLFCSDGLDFTGIEQIINHKRADFCRWLKAALHKEKNND